MLKIEGVESAGASVGLGENEDIAMGMEEMVESFRERLRVLQGVMEFSEGKGDVGGRFLGEEEGAVGRGGEEVVEGEGERVIEMGDSQSLRGAVEEEQRRFEERGLHIKTSKEPKPEVGEGMGRVGGHG